MTLQRWAGLGAQSDCGGGCILLAGLCWVQWRTPHVPAGPPLAQVLAKCTDWPPLYNLERLQQNSVPVAAATYFEVRWRSMPCAMHAEKGTWLLRSDRGQLVGAGG